MVLVQFRWEDKDTWNSRDVEIPEAGDYLASDGVNTWIMRRIGRGFIKTSMVKWWKTIKPSCKVVDPIRQPSQLKENIMPHYRDGTQAQIGDHVRGKGYNVKGPDGQLADIVGTVVGITPGSDSCNIQVAHVIIGEIGDRPNTYFFRQNEGVVVGCGAAGGTDGKSIGARIGLEYGQCDHFEKLP